MSTDDPTKNLPPAGADTTPTLEGIVARIDRLGALVLQRFDDIDKQLDKMGVRLDRMESEIKQTHSELYALRADFVELRNVLKEQMPQLR